MTETAIRVLLVEDDDEDYILARDMLSRTGHRFDVKRSKSMDSAVRSLDDGAFDIVLLDLSLPDSDGLDTFLRVRERAPAMPVVILTGHEDELIGIRAVQRGAQDYLSKSRLDRDRLVRCIRYSIERKRGEEDLKRYRDHLESLVAGATHELREANTRLQSEVEERKAAEIKLTEVVASLEALNTAKSEFVSNVSHELRTPLTSMTCALENLLRGVVGSVDEKFRDYLLMLQEDCRRLSATVNDILDLTRIEANKLTLDRKIVRFGRLVELATASLRIQAERKKQELTLQIEDASVFVSCDPAKLERVILNVIHNAIKFTGHGGHIHVSVHGNPEAPGQVVMDVSDDGIGIDQQFISRITERFFRGGTGGPDGAGIGLALSREIVEMHGGRLFMTSPPPSKIRGTQVSIMLPLASRPWVLAVDDDQAIRTALATELESRGYVVTCHESGDSALRALTENAPPAIVITDMSMPEMDGMELVGEIRLNPRLQKVPMLMLTGTDVDRARARILEGLGVPVLRKPWESAQLVTRIDDLIIGRLNLAL